MLNEEMSEFARTIYEQKYAWKDDDGNVVESWADTARRVASHVMAALPQPVAQLSLTVA